jgi:hypothetical protein
MPEPLPLAELLETLKTKGLPIGVREHLTVGRLLSRWDDTDTGSLRIALAALLARNPDEVALVRTSFDTLYGAPEEEEPKAQAEPGKAGRIPIPRRWIAAGLAAVLAVALVVTALLLPRPAKNSGHQQIPTGAQTVPKEAPPPPVIPDTYPRPAWGRSFAVAGGVAAVLFLWMYGTRLGREAQRRARRRWSEEADALPGPHGYDLDLGDLAPPFSAAVLDDVATLLGRHSTDPPRSGELDVNRTLERTIRAGLAPFPAFRSRASQHPLVVLEDVGAEMRPWRRTVRAFLNGLEARGVALDRWRFDGDAGRIFRSPGDPVFSLKQLFRLRPESPLLVISTGEGLLEGPEASPAAWIDTLSGWRSRAWLQPVTDPSYWRPALRAVPLHVWPMTPEGLLTTARQLAHGDLGRPVREAARAFSDRPVTALDIDRLRWLLSLAPRRDPDLAEQLRQRFCPHAPPAALLDALEMPALLKPPQIGPSAGDVHAFLLEILDRSRPEPGTAAFERWRLDRALQELRLPESEPGAVRELAALAQGPLAGDVETAVGAAAGVAKEAREHLRRQVWRTVRCRATTRVKASEDTTNEARLRAWPDIVEIAAALLCLMALGWGLPKLTRALREEMPVKPRQTYTLLVTNPTGPGAFTLQLVYAVTHKPDLLIGAASSAEGVTIKRSFQDTDTLNDRYRGRWYYLRDEEPTEDGTLAISNPVWVEKSQQDQIDKIPPKEITLAPDISPKTSPTPRNDTSTQQPSWLFRKRNSDHATSPGKGASGQQPSWLSKLFLRKRSPGAATRPVNGGTPAKEMTPAPDATPETQPYDASGQHELPTEIREGGWESCTHRVTYSLRADEEFVSAQINLSPGAWIADDPYTHTEHDPQRRIVTGYASFKSLKLPGSSDDCQIRLIVTVRVRPKSGA